MEYFIFLQTLILHMQKWGVLHYTRSLKYEQFRHQSHIKILPMVTYYALCFDGHNLMCHFKLQRRLSFLYLQQRVFLGLLIYGIAYKTEIVYKYSYLSSKYESKLTKSSISVCFPMDIQISRTMTITYRTVYHAFSLFKYISSFL